MAVRSYQLVLSATPKRLSEVYGANAASLDVAFRQLFISVDGADAYLGADATVSTTNYGLKAQVVGQSHVSGGVGPFQTGPVRFSDFYAVGAGATVHVLGVLF